MLVLSLLKVLLSVGVLVLAATVTALLFFIFFFKKHIKKRKSSTGGRDVLTVAFFHPYCNAGGGGERVLWCAINAMQTRYPGNKFVVYTGDIDASPDEILGRVNQRFNISLVEPVQFVYLHKRRWVEDKMYPHFTLLGQSIGSMYLGLEALNQLVPDVYIDTMGYAFTLPIFKYLGGCKIGCYVHYPTISSDMLKRVSRRVVAHNNPSAIARSPFLSAAKLLYYKVFASLYSQAGCCADIVMVNSSWTEEHINELWGCALKTYRVYPPCDVIELKKIPLKDDAEKQLKRIVSVAQFRPEKDHPLQLRAMYQLRQVISEEEWEKVILVLIGSCRDSADTQRVVDMKDLCKHLSLENNVEFKVNIPYEDLKKELGNGMIGLHAMWNEHFGIGVVECMAAGLIMVAHGSGGPQMDIVVESEGSRNGFLAIDEIEYAQVIKSILQMSSENRKTIREAARSSVDRFSVKEFEKGFLRAVDPFFNKS